MDREEAQSQMEKVWEEMRERAEKTWDKLSYEQKLYATVYIFKKICDHAKEGGTYRYLIYERLGFDTDAYLPLYLAGGMDISNEFELTDSELQTVSTT